MQNDVCLDMAFFLLMICYEDKLISISQLELIDIDLFILNSWEIFLPNNKMVEVGVLYSPSAYFQITGSINQPFHVRSCHIPTEFVVSFCLTLFNVCEVDRD